MQVNCYWLLVAASFGAIAGVFITCMVVAAGRADQQSAVVSRPGNQKEGDHV